MSELLPISFTSLELLFTLEALKDFSLEGRGSMSSAYLEEDLVTKFYNDQLKQFRNSFDPKQLLEKIHKLTPQQSEILIELCNEYGSLPDGVDKLAWREGHFNITD